MVDCDWCEEFFVMSEIFNVEYSDGFANVLCAKCVEVSKEINSERFVDAWN